MKLNYLKTFFPFVATLIFIGLYGLSPENTTLKLVFALFSIVGLLLSYKILRDKQPIKNIYKILLNKMR